MRRRWGLRSRAKDDENGPADPHVSCLVPAARVAERTTQEAATASEKLYWIVKNKNGK